MTYLFLLSIFSTSVRSARNYGTVEDPEWGRYTYFLPDNPVKHILVFMVLFIVLLFLKKNFHLIKSLSPKIIYITYFILLLLFIFNTQFQPKSDPAAMLEIAKEILGGDFHEFEKEGYMYRYPFQSGYILLCMAALRLFGEYAYLALQVVNAVAVTIFFYLLDKCVVLWWKYSKEQISLFTIFCMIYSLPLFIYVTFAYGNLPGMALSAAAVYLEQLYLREKKIYQMLGASACIAVAIVLKNNCLIPFIAMLILLIWELLKNEKRKNTLCAILWLVLCCVLINRGVSLTMETITGKELSQGMPKTAWVAMGLEESGAGVGVYNGTNTRIYEENNYQHEAADKAAKKEICTSIKKYINNPAAGISFFARKMAAQCNEPTFQAFSIVSDRETKIKVPVWINYLVAGRGSLYLIAVLNMIHTILLFGMCMYAWNIDIHKRSLNELIFLIAFIGNFIFQVFSEAKSQYMLIFFFMLLPYAFQGYHIAVKNLIELKKKGIKIKTVNYMRENKIKIGVFAVLGCIILTAGIRTGLFAHTICIQSSGELIEEYKEVVRTQENPNR